MSKFEYLLNIKSGERIPADDIFDSTYLNQVEFRRQLKDHNKLNKPIYVCGKCEQALEMKRKPNKKLKEFYFAHKRGSKECEWKYQDERSEYEARLDMYAGVRESEEHKFLKAFIAERLKEDEMFTDVNVEKRFYDKKHESYKVPDVSAYLQINKSYSFKKRIAFEIQLSTTFLDVVADREKFYYEEGDNILWIFSEYPKDLSRTKMTYDDILSSNKKNIFILDKEAREQSLKYKSLFVKNLYLLPKMINGMIEYRWSEVNIINIKKITYDEITGKSFVYNFEHERTKLLYIEKQKKTKKI